MRDKKKATYMMRCPSCGAISDSKQHAGVVCEKCHVFMSRIITNGAFENIDPETEVKNG